MTLLASFPLDVLLLGEASLDRLLAAELELRDVLLDLAREDDEIYGELRTGESLNFARGGWPLGMARDELRLVERRIYQIRECMK
jgi:hypothetical protein